MTIVELLSVCNKAANTMRQDDILLAMVFRQDKVILSASCKREETAHELSSLFSIQELCFLSKAAFSAQLSSLQIVLLEKVKCLQPS